MKNSLGGKDFISGRWEKEWLAGRKKKIPPRKLFSGAPKAVKHVSGESRLRQGFLSFPACGSLSVPELQGRNILELGSRQLQMTRSFKLTLSYSRRRRQRQPPRRPVLNTNNTRPRHPNLSSLRAACISRCLPPSRLPSWPRSPRFRQHSTESTTRTRRA